MRQQNFARPFCIVLAILFLPLSLPSRELNSQTEKKGKLRIVVTSNGDTKPVNGADVIVRAPDEDFEKSTKTDSQGVATIAGVPRVSLVIQISAMGWKTWGGQVDFKDDKPIQVTLEKDKPSKPSESPTP